MKSLKKGYTYLIRVGRIWYVVNQTGMKSWDAMAFTHWCVNHKNVMVHGNSVSILEKLKELIPTEDLEIVTTFNNAHLREKMFMVLKTGKVE